MITESYDAASRREWLVTNGIGGYASGTVAGSLTRSYHGYLIAALQLPLGRTMMLTKLDDIAAFDSYSFPLYANAWHSGVTEHINLDYLAAFELEGTTPVWRFEREGMVLEKRIFMQPGANTTYIHYDLLACPTPLTLTLKPMVNYRSHHETTSAEGWHMLVEKQGQGIKVTGHANATPFYVMGEGTECQLKQEWYYNYGLARERERGLKDTDDNLYAARFTATLDAGSSLTMVASTDPDATLDGRAAYAERRAYETALLPEDEPEVIQQLTLAADQVVVQRGQQTGKTVIAGYHWFADWGRDTMIALPGLTLSTQRYDIAKQILQTFSAYVDQGMLPNRFSSDAPDYNTVDATLWFFEAIRAYHAATGDDAFVKEIFSVLENIITWHQKGTRYGIAVDKADGLLKAGEHGVQLTWMDAKVDGWVVTPRHGKAVEVNALWYNALRIMEAFAPLADSEAGPYTRAADQVAASFDRFWAEDYGYLYDVIDSPGHDGSLVNDASLRPNQIFAVSLHHSPLSEEQQAKVLEVVEEHLLTPVGLRSLAPHDEAYEGHYSGNRYKRDGAYHQGTVWAWLIGPYADAHLRVHGDKAAARALLEGLFAHLDTHGLGTLSEIFDGDAPHHPRGAIAQAWSVAEVLRLWKATS